jgi:hypothetical protein
MGIPMVHLVAGPGFKRDISTSTIVNTTNRRKIPRGTGKYSASLLAAA